MNTIYTAIFGKYDDLKEPAHFSMVHGWRCVCFTDQALESDTWEIIKVPVMDCGPAKTARYYKINFHKFIESDFSIWIDGSFTINTPLDRWIRNHRDPFTTIKHPFDNCAYTDAQSCLSIGRGEPDKINEQIAFYEREGLPRGAGLISSGILMRNKNPEVTDFCEKWWQQVERFSNRDQISFTYTYWKNPITMHQMTWDYTTQKEFIHVPHLKKRRWPTQY
jgi:hypothetical protein